MAGMPGLARDPFSLIHRQGRSCSGLTERPIALCTEGDSQRQSKNLCIGKWDLMIALSGANRKARKLFLPICSAVLR